MIIYSNTYNYLSPVYTPQKGNINPQEYYENSENHGTFQYETLENLVNNFLQNYCGNRSHLSNTPRSRIIYHIKKGIQKFTFEALREIKVVELELGDALEIIMPPDFVNYVRISWLDTCSGQLHPMALNWKLPLATAYLQDHLADLLYDQDGNILEGTSATQNVNDRIDYVRRDISDCDCDGQNWSINTGKNYNGMFSIDKRLGVIHFTSNVADKIIVLEYISDGLEYSDSNQVMVHKFAEQALYFYTYWMLINFDKDVPQYEKRDSKKNFDVEYMKAKLKLSGFKIAETAQMLKYGRRWLRS